MTKDEVFAFLNSRPKGVFATAGSDGAPHAAMMLFLPNPDLSLYIATCKHFGKYKNLTENPKISFVITGPGDSPHELVEGDASVSEIGETETATLRDAVLERHGAEFLIKDEQDLVFFKVTPTGLRHIDGSSGAMVVTKIDL